MALLVAPILALADESVAFALVGWACTHQSAYAIHLVHLVFLAVTAACAVWAGRQWRVASHPRAGREPSAGAGFLVPLATASAALSTLAIAAMWVPTWLIASCVA